MKIKIWTHRVYIYWVLHSRPLAFIATDMFPVAVLEKCKFLSDMFVFMRNCRYSVEERFAEYLL